MTRLFLILSSLAYTLLIPGFVFAIEVENVFPSATLSIFFSERLDEDTPSSNLYFKNGDGTKVLIAKNVEDAQLSKDCQYIVFDQYSDTNGDKLITFDDIPELYISKTDGTNKLKLTADLKNSGQPSWSPDGNHISFRSERSGTGEVWIMNPDGTSQKQITTKANWAGHVKWSPDGKYIAFYSSDANGSYLSVIRPDGTGFRRLSSDVGNGWMITWTNKGEIVFPMEIGKDKQRSYSIDPNKKELINITGNDILFEDRKKCGWPLVNQKQYEW